MNEPVLVLNGNYEPLNVCTTKRAMGLILADKAMVVENGRGFIHTVSRAFERPSVIRLFCARFCAGTNTAASTAGGGRAD